MKESYKKILAGVTALTMMTVEIVGIYFNSVSANDLTASAAESASKTYSVNITLMQFQSTQKSMGNEAVVPQAHIAVNSDGTSNLQIDMIPMTYLGKNGYLGSLKKVTKVVKENRYHYPTEIETTDAEVLEEYTDVYDTFNDPNSKYADKNVSGKWYPKKLSIPVDFANKEDDILVQVYVPVMESIMAGGGTKFAVMDIDWDTLTEDKSATVTGDVNADGTFDESDVTLTQNYIIKTPDTKLANWSAADLNSDNKLNAIDLALLKRNLNK